MKKFILSLRHAVKGLALAIRGERNFKFGLFCTAVVIALGFLRHVSRAEWAILLICCGVVLALEMVNSAIEAVVDLATEEFHHLAKRAKDIAAGAVLLFCAVTVAVAAVIFLG